MEIVRWDPWHELSRMRGDVDDLFARSFGRPVRGWLPAADVARDDGEIVITMDLPGMTADDVEVELHDHALTISGERRRELEGKLSQERVFGSFVRSFALPGGVAGDDVTAGFADGVLTIRISHPTDRVTQRIEVKTATPTAA